VNKSPTASDAGVELRLLAALVAVADEASVSAAAVRLHVAQPSLSRQLRILERRLGLSLFERSGRRLRVTAAGAQVVTAARRALAAADDVVNTAHRAAVGHVGRLAVAVLPGASPVVLVDALAVFHRRHPRVETTVTELTDDEQHRGLREGRIDVALTRIATPPEDLPHRVLMTEPLCLVVPSGHRLVGAGHATIRDMGGEHVVFFDRSVHPVGHRWLSDQLRVAGVSAELQPATLMSIFAMVAAGLAVSVLVRSYGSLLRPAGVRFLPLTGLAIDLIMLWRPGPDSAVVREFRQEMTRASRDVLADQPAAAVRT
jgi:DNA-binding transcriptional LysR family regulator